MPNSSSIRSQTHPLPSNGYGSTSLLPTGAQWQTTIPKYDIVLEEAENTAASEDDEDDLDEDDDERGDESLINEIKLRLGRCKDLERRLKTVQNSISHKFGSWSGGGVGTLDSFRELDDNVLALLPLKPEPQSLDPKYSETIASAHQVVESYKRDVDTLNSEIKDGEVLLAAAQNRYAALSQKDDNRKVILKIVVRLVLSALLVVAYWVFRGRFMDSLRSVVEQSLNLFQPTLSPQLKKYLKQYLQIE